MERRWVTGPRGDYLVVSGTPRFRDLVWRFQDSGNDTLSPTDPFGAGAAWYQHLFRHGTNRGVVAVHAYGRHWAWVLPKGADVAPYAAAVVAMVESGEWVPEAMPRPPLRDAKAYGD
jgi:hypothetical protein